MKSPKITIHLQCLNPPTKNLAIIIFHQPRFFWTKGKYPLLNHHHSRWPTGWGRYNLLKKMGAIAWPTFRETDGSWDPHLFQRTVRRSQNLSAPRGQEISWRVFFSPTGTERYISRYEWLYISSNWVHLPQIGVKIPKNIWNHHPDMFFYPVIWKILGLEIAPQFSREINHPWRPLSLPQYHSLV